MMVSFLPFILHSLLSVNPSGLPWRLRWWWRHAYPRVFFHHCWPYGGPSCHRQRLHFSYLSPQPRSHHRKLQPAACFFHHPLYLHLASRSTMSTWKASFSQTRLTSSSTPPTAAANLHFLIFLRSQDCPMLIYSGFISTLAASLKQKVVFL